MAERQAGKSAVRLGRLYLPRSGEAVDEEDEVVEGEGKKCGEKTFSRRAR